MKIAILSPAFPSAINGLGDYSAMVGEKLSSLGCEVVYIGLQQQDQVTVYPYQAIDNNKANLINILQELAPEFLYINYSGYGYQRKGMPIWLIGAIKAIKKTGIIISTFFHEVYASGKIHQPVYWYSKVQKNVYQKLLLLSDIAFCSNQIIYNIITKENKNAQYKIHNLGLFSNIPVANNFIPFNQREKNIVVFGTLGRRLEVYKNPSLINAICRQLQANKIIDIGAGNIEKHIRAINITVEIKGELPKNEIAAIMQSSCFALISYPSHILGKSGIFAAYAGNGLCIVNVDDSNTVTFDGIMDGSNLHNVSVKEKMVNEDMAFNAFTWYQNRSIENHGKKIYSNLQALIK